MRFIAFVFFLSVILLGSSVIKDFDRIPQDSTKFDLNLTTPPDFSYEEFKKRYFSPWDLDFNGSKKDFLFGVEYIKNKRYFDEAKKPISEKVIEKIIDNANLETFPTHFVNAITLKNCDFRLLPTAKPFFYDFEKSFGGYPFDYMQNSMVHINTPIKILHYSKDKAYAFVQASYVSGWVKSEDIAPVSWEQINRIKLMKLVSPKQDNLALIANERFVAKVFIGAIFFKDCDEKIYFFTQDANAQGVLKSAYFDDTKMTVLPRVFDKANIDALISQLYGQNYGWGGYLQNRDCSMLMRDFYTQFGLFLPRNSIDQAHDKPDEMITFKDTTNEEKIALIRQFAKPFRTMFYMKGHIMMYIGEFAGEPIIFHSFWSIKTKNNNRLVIGGSYITTLMPGIELENYDKAKGTLLDKLLSMRVFKD